MHLSKQLPRQHLLPWAQESAARRGGTGWQPISLCFDPALRPGRDEASLSPELRTLGLSLCLLTASLAAERRGDKNLLRP